MRNTKNAFTLVELIVVITILAILGTIAFISLQGYSADARNSKRTSDIGNIQSAINLKQVEGTDLMSFVNGTSANLATIALAGSGATATPESSYAAGTPNYTVLNIDAKDFKDPNDQEYKVGATKAVGGKFQVAATMEIDGTNTAIVNGTYVARLAGTNTGTVATAGTAVSGNTLVVLSTADANKFKAGDFVTDGANGAKILKVSKDGITITLEGAVTGYAAAASVNLQNAETAGLIADKTDNTKVIVNNGTTYLPY